MTEIERISAESETEFQSLDPQVIRFEIVGGVIFTGFTLVLMLIGLAILWFIIGTDWIFGSACATALVILLLLVFFTFDWPHRSYRHTRWKLDDEGLEIQRGVIWRHRISVPIGRVQHADVSQGPLQRQFGLGKLTVNTAGTQDATVELDGLSHENALALRDRLVHQTGHHEVT